MAEETSPTRTLLVVVAHPDDESFGCGALIAATAASGADVVVCCASRGERGEDASGRYGSPEALGRARERELREAAQILGVAAVEVLGLADSGWDGDAEAGSIVAEPGRLGALLDDVIGTHRPDVVVTLDPTGSDGHRDHAAVGAATTAAFERVVDWPATLYHWCLPHSLMDAWSREIAARNPDSVYLETELGRPDSDITTTLDGRDVVDTVWRAIACHTTQATPYDGISPDLAEQFVRHDHLVRQRPVMSAGLTEGELCWPMPAMLEATDAGFDEALGGFNLAVRHRPERVCVASSTADVVAAMRHAVDAGLRVAVLATGHGWTEPVDGGLMLSTAGMQTLRIDPERRLVTVGAGVRWQQVIDAATPHGLAPLNGSSTTVGAVGYTLGGGMGPMARTFGFAADHVVGLELVTPDGVVRTVDREHEPELFWALRGGRPAVGVVTELTFRLMPVTRFYGGAIFFDGTDAATVTRAWRDWSRSVPGEVTTSIALLRLPDMPAIPEPIRGRLSVHLRYVHIGDPAEGATLLEPMRACATAVLDDVHDRPYAEIAAVHMDPVEPLPCWDRGILLAELPDAALDALVATAGPGADAPLILAELRLLGGALTGGCPGADADNAAGGRDAAYGAYVVGAFPPELAEATPTAGSAVIDALRPWSSGTQINFQGSGCPASERDSAWPDLTRRRLRDVAARFDPSGVMWRG